MVLTGWRSSNSGVEFEERHLGENAAQVTRKKHAFGSTFYGPDVG